MRFRRFGAPAPSAARGPDGRRAGRGADQRGIAMVEAAIVTPVFLLMLFAVMEFGMAMNDYLGLSNAVQAGARTASASAVEVNADYGILQALSKESSAITRSSIGYIVVFNASPTTVGGAPVNTPTAGCQGGTPSSISGQGGCNVYTTASFALPQTSFGCSATSPDRYWCPTTRKTSQTVANGGPPDYIGVWMKVTHPWVTKLFGNAVTLTDSTVIRIEPRQL